MKYLKKFENNDILYVIGNYVVLKNENSWLDTIYNCFKIVGYNNRPSFIDVEYVEPSLKLIEETDISKNDIDRMATDEEIKKYEILKSSILYNL